MPPDHTHQIVACCQLNFPSITFDINLTLSSKGTTVIFGRSGCGKTTLLRFLAGLERPPLSRLIFKGTVWQDESRRIFVPLSQRSIGYVFQDPRLFPHLSVRSNLLYGYTRTAPEHRHITPDRVIDLLQLRPYLDRRPTHLSGGEQQRVAIGRALLTTPHLLLMDEPLSSLDLQRKQEVLPFLKRLNRELGIPLIYVTHALEEVLQLADQVVVLKEGTVRANGTVQEVFSELGLRHVLPDQHIGAVLDTQIADHDQEFGLTRLEFSGGRLHIPRLHRPVGDHIRVQLLAKDVSIVTGERPFLTSVLNVLPATVLEIGPIDPDRPFVDIKLDIGAPLLATITRKSLSSLHLQPGNQVYAQIKAVAFSHELNSWPALL